MAVVLLLMVSCSADRSRSVHKSAAAMMGTLVEISIVGNGDKAKVTAHKLFQEIQRIDNLASFHKPSPLTRSTSMLAKAHSKRIPNF